MHLAESAKWGSGPEISIKYNVEGTPCNLKTSLIYNCANLIIDMLKLTSSKWTLFVNQSSITHTTS